MIRKLFLFLILGFTIHCLSGQTITSVKKTTLVVKDQVVPSFKFEISKGKTVSFSEYRGKVVLINFFATWCGPCLRELPLVQEQIWNKHKDDPKFAMLTFGREHSWEEVLKFGKDKSFTFPLLPDPKRNVYGLFATELIPRSFLIDTDGKIIYLSEGFEEPHFIELKELIDKLLNL